jgi:hypothetical protein
VAVRTHTPGHWWLIGGVFALLLLAGLGRWAYDQGGRAAGFDRGSSEQRIATLQAQLDDLQKNVGHWRSLADVGESRLQIEQAAQQQLTRQVQGLEGDNARLKDELALFENLARTEGQATGLSIQRLRAEADAVAAQHYRYHLLAVMAGAAREQKEFKGELQLLIRMRQQGQDVMMTLPVAPQPAKDVTQYHVSFKYFRRIDGEFTVPSGARVVSLEARLLQNGTLKASRSVTL